MLQVAACLPSYLAQSKHCVSIYSFPTSSCIDLYLQTELRRERQLVQVTDCADAGPSLQCLLGHLPDLFLGDAIHALRHLVDLVGLVAVYETGTSQLHTGLCLLAELELLEFGECLGLGEVLLVDALGETLEHFRNLGRGGLDVRC